MRGAIFFAYVVPVAAMYVLDVLNGWRLERKMDREEAERLGLGDHVPDCHADRCVRCGSERPPYGAAGTCVLAGSSVLPQPEDPRPDPTDPAWHPEDEAGDNHG